MLGLLRVLETEVSDTLGRLDSSLRVDRFGETTWVPSSETVRRFGGII